MATRKSSSRKSAPRTTAPRSPAVEPEAAATEAAPVSEATPVPVEPEAEAVAEAPAKVSVAIKKKDLIARIVEATGGKKKDVKEIVEATLVALGDALSRGEELNLPPFGKLKVNRQRDMASGEMMTLKLRRGGGKDGGGAGKEVEKDGKEALAEAED